MGDKDWEVKVPRIWCNKLDFFTPKTKWLCQETGQSCTYENCPIKVEDKDE